MYMIHLCSLSHRPTLIAKSIVIWRVSALSMKNAPPRMGLEPATVVVLFGAHRANHLRHGGLRCWQKLANFYCTVTELLALCYPQTKFIQLAERLWVRVQVQLIFSLIRMLIISPSSITKAMNRESG